MEIVESKTDSLSRNFAVKVMYDELLSRLDEKIDEIQPQVNLKGFRPGKVPASHIKKIFGDSMMEDVIKATIEEATTKAVSEHSIRTASQPEINMQSDMKKVVDGEPLEFDLNVDVMPEFEVKDVSTIALEKQVTKPTKKEINERLDNLANNNRSYSDRPKTQKAKKDDRLTIDFLGKIDDEPFEGGAAEQQILQIGAGRFIPGFEEGLVGAKTGQDLMIDVTFPDDYSSPELAGKAAQFDIKVHKIEMPGDAPNYEDLAKLLGLESEEQLTERISEMIEQEYSGLSQQKLKRSLLDALDGEYDFELPPRMVDQEFDTIWQQIQNDPDYAEELKKKDNDEGKMKAEYKAIAERRVKLGLVLAEIGRNEKVEVSNDEVGRAIVAEAQKYPGQEEQIIEIYKNNPQAQMQIRAPLFEEKVVSLVLDKVKITEKKVSRAELEKEDDSPYLD